MRRDDLYIGDILKAAKAISLFLANVDEAQFVADESDTVRIISSRAATRNERKLYEESD